MPDNAPLPPDAQVLVVRLSALGDILFALETVASLKAERPDVRIHFLVEDRFASLLDHHPQLERVWVYPRSHKLRIPAHLLALRRVDFDCVLDLHGIAKSAWQVLFAKSRRMLGYTAPGSREGSHRLYRRPVALPDPLPHRADRGYFLLRALGLRGERTAPVLPPPPEPPTFWNGVGRPRVLLHPGASAFAAFKRWPVERYAELALRLSARDVQVAVSHGPGERALADAVVQQAPATRILNGVEPGLVGFAHALGQADLVVAGDTGPLHLAAAAGAEVVALMGPKDPEQYGPRAHDGHTHRVLHADVPCRPCTRRKCPSPQCVLGLTVDEVESIVRAALS